MREVEGGLRDRLAVDERDDFVHAAVVVGHDEARVQPAARIDGKLSEQLRRLRIFLATEMVIVFDDPTTGNGAPREIDGLPGGKTARCRVCNGADNRRLVVREIERRDL